MKRPELNLDREIDRRKATKYYIYAPSPEPDDAELAHGVYVALWDAHQAGYDSLVILAGPSTEVAATVALPADSDTAVALQRAGIRSHWVEQAVSRRNK